MDNEIKYGWYSQSAENDGRSVYLYLNPNYQKKYVTTVNNSSEKNPYGENSIYNHDSKCVGIVTEFIKEFNPNTKLN